MNRKQKIIIWILALICTLGLVLHQRMTGPTKPFRGQENLGEYQVSYRLLRSHLAEQDLPVQLRSNKSDLQAYLLHRRFPSRDQWTRVEMQPTPEGGMRALIPGQPPAGKVEYRIEIMRDDAVDHLPAGRTLIARFRGPVPTFFLVLHVLLMFAGILLALRTALGALFKEEFKLLPWVTFGVIICGGLVLGPIVQKYAFGHFWTGFPFGWDLTDNKTLLVVLVWALALFFHRKSNNRFWLIGAATLMLLVYLIPHSLLGSELDYETGKVSNLYRRFSCLMPGQSAQPPQLPETAGLTARLEGGT